MSSVENKADFSYIRYAQCWEDADILLEGLAVKPGSRCLSIASGGENSFSILSKGAEVTAIDLSLPQLAVTDLKKAAYRNLSHEEFLGFIGVSPAEDRRETYERLKQDILPHCREYLDAHPDFITKGIIHEGKFENYFRLFRTRILPLIHSDKTVAQLLESGKSQKERGDFYRSRWNNLRYRILFRIFFSRQVMGKHGRDKAFFDHVEGNVSGRIKQRVKNGLIDIDPSENPYLHYILTGGYGNLLPHALRRENFDAIKDNIEKLELVQAPIEAYLDQSSDRDISGFNLSDIFEYMDLNQMYKLYEKLIKRAVPGARTAYWNMLAERRGSSELLPGKLPVRELEDLSQNLHTKDKAFFYSRFIVEEVL